MKSSESRDKSVRIPLNECVKGHVYRLLSRNLSVGVFNGNIGFIGVREKFGDEYLFTEYHWDNGAPYGTAHPKEDLGPIPDGVELRENGPPVCKKTGRPVTWRNESQYWYDGNPSTGRWCYEGTDEPIPEYPESQAVSPVNTALFDYLKPLSDAAWEKLAEERGFDLVRCSRCNTDRYWKDTKLVGSDRVCESCAQSTE
jgi:hypothetical protein